jgi:mannose/cellobiose epimerase-like protein (N-acyl-D-glucosamine 2-epimerase family)
LIFVLFICKEQAFTLKMRTVELANRHMRDKMNNDIPLKYYDIVDEYSTEAAETVSEAERDSLANYFQLLLTRLMNNEEISEEAQQRWPMKLALMRCALMISPTS